MMWCKTYTYVMERVILSVCYNYITCLVQLYLQLLRGFLECAESHHLGSQVVTVSAYESVYYRTGTVIAAPCQVFDKIQFWYVAKVVEGPHKEP